MAPLMCAHTSTGFLKKEKKRTAVFFPRLQPYRPTTGGYKNRDSFYKRKAARTAVHDLGVTLSSGTEILWRIRNGSQNIEKAK